MRENTRADTSNIEIVSVVTHTCGLDKHSYRTLWKYYQAYRHHGMHNQYPKNPLRGENYKKKARVVILACNTPGQLDLHHYQILSENLKGSKNHGVHKIFPVNFYEGKVQGHRTLKVQELSFLHVTCLLVLILNSTKYYQNISKHKG